MRLDRRLLTTSTSAASIILAAALLAPAAANGQTRFTLVPSVAFSAISDSNVFSTELRSADRTTQLGPSLEGLVQTPRGSLHGLYGFDMLRSAYFAALNEIEARRHGKFEAHVRTTPKAALSLSSHYDRSQNAGELNFESAFLVPRRRASRWEVNPGYSYRPTPYVTVRGSYNWVREDLEQWMVAYEHVARMSATRELSPRTSLTAGYLGRHFVNAEDTQTSHAAVLGWTWRVKPFTALTVLAGPRLAARGELDAEVTASLVRRAPGHFTYAFDYWRGESIILGVLGPVEVESATGRFTWPIRRNVEVGARGGRFTSNSVTQGGARVNHAEAIFSWIPKPFYAVTASYGVDYQHGDIRSSFFRNRNVERRVFTVKLTLAPRLTRDLKPQAPADPLAGPRSREYNRD